jgi:hypothetical protein
MLRFRRPARSLLLFLAVPVGVGAALGDVATGGGIALFFLFISSIEPKPAWRFWFDPPGDEDSGRAAGRFNSWQRVGATSPKEISRLPSTRD